MVVREVCFAVTCFRVLVIRVLRASVLHGAFTKVAALDSLQVL